MSGPILNCINSMAHRPPTVVSELALISGIALLLSLIHSLFSRPSSEAGVVMGRSANGLTEWRVP